MKEHEFKCRKCGNVWYATDEDIKEYNRQKDNIQYAKLKRAPLLHGKKYRNATEEIAQMQYTQRNPYHCSKCGSRDIEVDGKVYNEGNNIGKVKPNIKFWTALAIVFMPYLAIVLLLWKKPFSRRINRIGLGYSLVMCLIVIAAAIYSGGLSNPSTMQGNVTGENIQSDEIVYDVTKFSKVTGAELIGILGQPDSVDEGTCTGAFEVPCVYYDYDNAEGLGDVSFALVNNSVVRFTSYNTYPYTDSDEILNAFGISMGENGSKAEDNGTALRYRCPADGIDDFRADLIEGETFGSLQVTYDMAFYEEWYIPMSISDMSDYQYATMETVKQLLKSPKSADFPNITDGWSFGKNQHYVAVQSYVDAQNSFGAEVRSEFTFIYFADTNTIAYAVFDGEVIANNGYTATADIVNGLYDAEKQKEALASVSAG